MGEKQKKSSGKGFLISIIIILFLVNVWKFLNNPGSVISIVVTILVLKSSINGSSFSLNSLIVIFPYLN